MLMTSAAIAGKLNVWGLVNVTVVAVASTLISPSASSSPKSGVLLPGIVAPAVLSSVIQPAAVDGVSLEPPKAAFEAPAAATIETVLIARW